MLIGQYKNGVIVFSNRPALQEGTMVRVEPMTPPAQAPVRGTPAAFAGRRVSWAGDASELDELLEEVQRAREANLTDTKDDL